jgi:hypothetical protein
MNVTPPRFVALCGNPKSGKSLAQEILQETFGYIPVDDGFPMREFAVNNLGLTWDDVRTQEGKARYTNILGRDWQHREILGILGNHFEDMFGADIMPLMAVNRCDPDKLYSFGSVRREQGKFYKDRGGIVIEIVNPDAKPSSYEFDRYNPDICDSRIYNDYLHIGEEPAKARELFKRDLITTINLFTRF